MERTIGEDRADQPSETSGNSEHPLGPWLLPARRSAASARGIGASLVIGGATVLVVAAALTPPSVGFGAHEQLGLAPCSIPVLFGVPCPTCGMTTSFTHFARGHVLASLHTQPAAFLIAAGVVVGVLTGFVGLVTGRTWRINWYRTPPGRVAIVVAGVLLLGWGYKVATVLLVGW